MRTFITCMGECLIDFLPLPENAGIPGFQMFPAGSHLNVAVGVARLGQASAFACKMADDYFGHFLRSYIEQNKIDTRYLTTVEGLSTLAFVATENGHPAFTFYGEGTADALLTPADVPAALFEETRILHIGCISLLRGSTPATIRATFEQLKGKALLSLDPNLRPPLVKDEPAYRALLQHLISLTDVLKLSDEDLSWLLPNRSLEDALQSLLQQGPALVVVTRGAQGSSAIKQGGELFHVPGFAVPVKDTVGAGDTFCAGLLTQLADRNLVTHDALTELQQDELTSILRFAAAAAAINCTRTGANPPTRDELIHFLNTQS
ncbi:carbohydrate kinase family protein [Dictyobacter arantiisoli]|uniref:Carbohydrate kinase n=1 Tax=Dictyobacter arantiisoli TaxID=2014874 RepID=A0A5A5TAJ6_9CHLR|nr:carbohydrate kinase [Dictyobacter arantiisoli]GCF08442.1 carbohydrate kinase [Dictyobacter arantiisoli]